MVTLTQNFLQFLFPITCAGCGSDLPADDYYRICHKCEANIKFIEEFCCRKCGSYLPYGGSYCYHCLKKPHYHFEYIRSAGLYEGILKDLIHRFKYQNRDYICRFLGSLLVRTIEKHSELKEIDFVIPVPMHWFKKIRRGYNQAEILAKIAAKHIEKPMFNKQLKRSKLARPQVGLTRKMRLQNTKDCFVVFGEDIIRKKNILLIDDVSTTGATIDECSRVLKQAGAAKIYGMTVAHD